MGPLPITSKLLPFRWKNLVHLAEVAALTRMATGVARVMENRPSQQNDPRLSQNQKRQALTERFFVEILGTAGYMGFLHLGQDIVDKISASIKHPIPSFSLLPAKQKADLQKALNNLGITVEQFDQKIKEVYNPNHLENERSGLLYRVLYEHDAPTNKIGPDGKRIMGTAPKATLASLQEKIVEMAKNRNKEVVVDDFKNVLGHCKELEEFACSNNKWAAGAILTGVALSAAVGGTLTQWMNDRLVAPTAKHWLDKKFINDSKPKILQLASQKLAALPFLPQPIVGQRMLPPVQAANPFNFPATAAAMPQQPAIAPVYLPNPKMQPPATAFGARSLPRPYTTPLSSYSYSGTRLGGGL